MHGKGTFYDPRLNDATQFPVAVKAGSANVHSDSDLITTKLASLHFYQLAIPAPQPPQNDRGFNFPAQRGKALFNGKAQCAPCRVPPLLTEPGFNQHTPEDLGIDDFQANRSPTKMYRTTPLEGLFSHRKGGFFHDGRFPDCVLSSTTTTATCRQALSDGEKTDLLTYFNDSLTLPTGSG